MLWFCMDVWILWVCMDCYGFVWILVCSISRVCLGIHPNPRLVEIWIGKTLICITLVWNPPFEYGFLVYDIWIHVWVLGS